MTAKRFINDIDNGKLFDKKGELSTIYYSDSVDFYELWEFLNKLNDENEQLRNRINDWHQRTFKAHEYFNILEKVIDEVCDDDISNEIWKEYEKREKLIE